MITVEIELKENVKLIVKGTIDEVIKKIELWEI